MHRNYYGSRQVLPATVTKTLGPILFKWPKTPTRCLALVARQQSPSLLHWELPKCLLPEEKFLSLSRGTVVAFSFRNLKLWTPRRLNSLLNPKQEIFLEVSLIIWLLSPRTHIVFATDTLQERDLQLHLCTPGITPNLFKTEVGSS